MNKITIDYEYYKDLLKKEDLLNELEEWLKEQEIEYPSYYWELNNKIQELKQKYYLGDKE